MKESEEEALRIILIMRRDLHFSVDVNSILVGANLDPAIINILIDSESKDFYENFFANVCRQMQLLVALGDIGGAEHVLNSTKDELCTIIKKATHTNAKILFSIPNLEDCLNLKTVA